MQLTDKNSLIICLGFLLVGLFLVLNWKENENVYAVGWVALFIAGLIGLLTFVNFVFEKPNTPPPDFSKLTNEGINLQINRFPSFLILTMPGGLIIWFTIMEAMDNNFGSNDGFWFLLLFSLVLLYFSAGWLVLKYTLYPDRISVRNILSPPFYKNIPLSDIISARTISRSEEKDRIANRPTRNKAVQGVALVMFGFAKQGNYGSVILETRNKKVELYNVRYPERLVETIKQLKNNQFNEGKI